MDFSMGGADQFDDERSNNQNSNIGDSDQKAQLETSFEGCDHTARAQEKISQPESEAPTREFVPESVDMEEARMLEVATTAMDELLRLVNINEPLWTRSSDDRRFALVTETYKQMFPRANSFKRVDAREESSKYSQTVNMGGMQLVEMFLDSDKWATLFPTFVSKADTIKVLDAGLLGTRSGALQLMYEEMHVLSPLIPSREFFFLRYCKQVEVDSWLIADVTFDSFEGRLIPLSCSRRLPSGCLIRETMTGTTSTVTWVERVEMNDMTQTSWLYRNIACNNVAYGAERWLMALQRTCDKIGCLTNENIPDQVAEGVINLRQGKMSLTNLSHRMVQSFCRVLNPSSYKANLSCIPVANNNGVNMYIRNTTQGQPDGIVVSVVGSVWLPVPPHNVFDLFRDVNRRHEWDTLAYGNPVCEVLHIPIGSDVGNRISILEPFGGSETNMVIFQETFKDPLVSYVIFAPIDKSNMDEVARGQDSSKLPILPSGFTITGNARAVSEAFNTENVVRIGGTLLTVAFQILISSGSTMGEVRMGTLATVYTLFNSTVQNIKFALNCP